MLLRYRPFLRVCVFQPTAHARRTVLQGERSEQTPSTPCTALLVTKAKNSARWHETQDRLDRRKMPLDINTIRAYKGGDPEKVRESQRRRFADVALVDKVIEEDEEWRPVWKSKFYGAFVLNRRVVLHAIDAAPARWPRRAPDTLVDFHTGGGASSRSRTTSGARRTPNKKRSRR